MGEGKAPHPAKCLYEILGVSRDSSQEEIRSAYKKLALQRHPDKLISTGVPEAEATAAFQSLLNAYQVLSDPRERSWYDSHRSQILFADASPSSSPSAAHHLFDVSQILPFFSNSAFSGFSDSPRSFYTVYGDLFSKIHSQELSFARELGVDLDIVGNAPLIGNLDSPYAQVSAFYSFWLGFSTVMDFSWVDPWNPSGAVPSRKARRVMEDENRKARKRAKKDFNETVRSLAEFVKKRDKRVIEMQMKRNLEEVRRRAEAKERKEEELRKRMERARSYQEPEWARIDEEEEVVDDGFEEEEDGKKTENELYCVVCSKKFKSEKQWKNHEQSKKHREKVAELRVSFNAEDKEDMGDSNEEKGGVMGNMTDEIRARNFDSNEQTAENVDDLCEEFEDALDLGEEQQSETKSTSGESVGEKEGLHPSFGSSHLEEGGDLFGSNEEMSILEAMVSGHESRKNAPEHQPESTSSGNLYANGGDEESLMEYDTRKNTRSSRGSRKAGTAKSNAGAAGAGANGVPGAKTSDANGSDILPEKDDTNDISSYKDSSESFFAETNTKIVGDGSSNKNQKPAKQSTVRKGAVHKDTNVKAKGSSKGKKQKATSKTSGHTCETCGENFESRFQLVSGASIRLLTTLVGTLKFVRDGLEYRPLKGSLSMQLTGLQELAYHGYSQHVMS